ncbi:MAG: putative lipid II flippase FtsW [Treponema sp.]|jgi:cell division protein FtsW|nr:putative lipid II flippase FtsW [Treponema sp.]
MSYHFEKTAPERGIKRDHILIASVFLLVGLGMVTLYSSSYAFARRFFNDSLYFISRQLVMGGAGLVLFFIAARINLEWMRSLIKVLVIGTMILCVLTFIPGIGVVKNGAARWIRLGPYTYQPSELVKLTLPVYLAHIFDKKEGDPDNFSRNILHPVLITAVFFLLIYLQNNFSTAVFIAFNALVIFFLAGVKLRFFFGAVMILLPLSSLLVLTREHRLRRLISFIWPEWEPQGAGYQVRSSILSIISGGFWGKGIGQGTRKIASVPEIHSDFIFSSFSEESGFIGVLLFVFLFGVFTLRGYRAGLGAAKTFPRLLGLGLVTVISSQALLNIAVVSGVLPATGIPLPFFSAGGSSLATTLLSAGLVVNISGAGGMAKGGE